MYHHLAYVGTGMLLPACLLLLAAYTHMVNPFGRVSRVKQPFTTKSIAGRIVLVKKHTPKVRASVVWQLFAYYKCGWHIVSNVLGGPRARSTTVEKITEDIHHLRFNPTWPYLISGDHFSVLYPRNLGIFYHSMLDPHTAHGRTDWEWRQRIYLQTVALSLEVFRVRGDCATTVVPVGARSFSCINIYRYPSDSLYGVLFGLSALLGTPHRYDAFMHTASAFSLGTVQAAQELLCEYGESIVHLFNTYYARVYDATKGLVRSDIAIASAKDSVVRQSSFYDNVIFWKTCALMQELHLPLPDSIDLDQLKARILATFWYAEKGYFIDHLSKESLERKHYSADWLIAFLTGFLDVTDSKDREYLSGVVAYTLEQKLDMPFPLKYQESDRVGDEVFFVRVFVPSYGGSAIWSFWGAEFIKLLVVLSDFEHTSSYLMRARTHIDTYESLMVRYKGYPEVYRKKGTMLRSFVYKSVRQTGWVVGFEQAQQLLKSRAAQV